MLFRRSSKFAQWPLLPTLPNFNSAPTNYTPDTVLGSASCCKAMASWPAAIGYPTTLLPPLPNKHPLKHNGLVEALEAIGMVDISAKH